MDGEQDDDVAHGGAGDDFLWGGDGTDVLWGMNGDDGLMGEGGVDELYGGDGYDTLSADRAETLNGGEYVGINIIGDHSPDNVNDQDDGWSCGPNSGSRFLRAYGITVSYEDLRDTAGENNIISGVDAGTPPPNLREILSFHKPDVQLESRADFQTVLDLLGQGKPVIALTGWGETFLGPAGIAPGVAALHRTERIRPGFPDPVLHEHRRVASALTASTTSEKRLWDWPGWGPVDAQLAMFGIDQNTIIY